MQSLLSVIGTGRMVFVHSLGQAVSFDEGQSIEESNRGNHVPVNHDEPEIRLPGNH
jgi:hypothetical protein